MLVNPNLLIDSQFKNPNFWVTYRDYSQEGVTISTVFDETSSRGIILEASEDLLPNTDYTMSVYVKGERPFYSNYNYFIDRQGGNFNVQDNGKLYSANVWNRVTVIFRHDKNFNYKSIMIGFYKALGGENKIQIKYPKLEIGSVATPYIPNEKDLDTSKQQLLTGGGYLQRDIPNLELKRVVGYAS